MDVDKKTPSERNDRDRGANGIIIVRRGRLAPGNDDADDGMRGVLDSDRLVAWLWPGAALP